MGAGEVGGFGVMLRAGRVEEISIDSGNWLVLDIGFSSNKKTCGLKINNEHPKEVLFSEAKTLIISFVRDSQKPTNLIIEAPLSVAFNKSGNPTGRSIEKQGAKTRYWYTGLGCTVMVSAMYLIKAISEIETQHEVRVFEGFVSFKNKNEKSNHSKDVEALYQVVENPLGFHDRIINPKNLKISDDDTIQSAFLINEINLGVPPIIKG